MKLNVTKTLKLTKRVALFTVWFVVSFALLALSNSGFKLSSPEISMVTQINHAIPNKQDTDTENTPAIITGALPSDFNIQTHPESGCKNKITNDNLDLSQTIIVQKDTQLVTFTNDPPISYYRLTKFDYDEVKGLVAFFKDAYITGPESVVTDCFVVYQPGGSGYGQDWNTFQYKTDVKKDNTININNDVISISSYWCDRYYHWLIECFLRLTPVIDFILAHPNIQILNYDPPNEDLWYLYELLGLDKSRFIEYNSMNMYHATQYLLVPTATAEGRTNVYSTQQMSKRLRNAFENTPKYLNFRKQYVIPNEKNPSKMKKNIVVQKRHGTRGITNHDELMTELKTKYSNKEYNIWEYDTTKSDSIEMVAMHYFADLLIGPHGAGLSNAIFMDTSGAMLEIYMKQGMMGSNDWYNPCHRKTSFAMGIEYEMMRAESGSHGSELTVDTKQVIEHSELVLTRNDWRLKKNIP